MDQQAVAFARNWAYYVRLVSHGLDPTAPLVTALYKVTVKAAAPRPDPEPIAVSIDGVVKVMSITDSETGDTFTCGNDWIIQGENLKDSVQTCTYVSRKVILCPFSVQADLLQTGNWWRLDTHAEPSSPLSPCSDRVAVKRKKRNPGIVRGSLFCRLSALCASLHDMENTHFSLVRGYVM